MKHSDRTNDLSCEWALALSTSNQIDKSARFSQTGALRKALNLSAHESLKLQNLIYLIKAFF
jgi:hypothetical protein